MLKIGVIGLGYVGLPICLNISKTFNTIGFDINQKRISNLKKLIITMNLKKIFSRNCLNFQRKLMI